MILHSLVGLVLWLLATLGFRFYGQAFFYPDDIVYAILFIAVFPALWGFMVLYLSILRVLPENRALASIGFVLPGLILDAIVTANFALVFPNLDAAMDTKFGALMMWSYGALLLGGYSADRRVRKAMKLPVERIAVP